MLLLQVVRSAIAFYRENNLSIVSTICISVSRCFNMKLVNYTRDPNQKPQLTPEQEAKLAALSDEDIDYSDIRELDDGFWKNVQIVYPDPTQLITLKIKSSVIQYFKAQDEKDYQSKINAVLESYVKAQKRLKQE